MKKRLTVIALACLLGGCGLFEQVPKEPETLVMPTEVQEQFATACKTLLAEHRGGVPACYPGRNGWVYQGSELRYGASGPFFGAEAREIYPQAPEGEADPRSAIEHFRDQLKSRGIELLFVPIPVRPVIYPEGVVALGEYEDQDPFPHLKPMQDEFLRLVRKDGVRVLDLTAFFLRNRRHERGPLYCKSDTHWTPSGTALAADLVGQYIKNRRWYDDVLQDHADPENPFTAEWLHKKHFGHIYRTLRDTGGVEDLPSETISYRRISGPDMDGEGGQKLRHPSSPVIVLGDSNLLMWGKDDAGFPQQLAFELGFHVDALTTNGGGVNEARLNLIRELREHSSYLDDKKALVWTFTARTVIEVKPYWVKTPLP